ncbi:MAG TPA: hypothetical protein VFP60_17275 [Pseudolabrys sp.]|nr:hypothetical protein [Pseudolabrys sp.]
MAYQHQQSHHPAPSMMNAVADWITRYRTAVNQERELAQIGPNEVAAIAKDIGISSLELHELAHKGAKAGALLKELLVALGVDPEALAKMDRRIARDMQWLCIHCENSRRCRHELSAGTAAGNFRAYCPNAITIEEVFGLENPSGGPTVKS